MKASLVVCTRNRASRLALCLASLDALDLDGAEIVVVDNGSEDGTGGVLREWARDRENVRILDEPCKGLGRARNTGWRAARGETVVFTDDDCYPAPDYVQQHVRLYQANPRLGWITGRILLHDPNDAKITIQENMFEVHHPPHRFLDPGSVHGANMSFRKSALVRIDGFDPLMGVGSYFPCEDIDAAARACFAGFEGMYSPSPFVYHHHGRQLPHQVRALECAYRKGRGGYYAKCLADRSMRRTYLRRILGKWYHQSFSEICGEARAIVSWNWTVRKLARTSPSPEKTPG